MNNEICVVSFVSTYFGDCAWKLNLARAAFICVEKKTAVLSQSLCQICTFHPNFKEKDQCCTFLSSFLGGKSMSEDVRPVEGREEQISAHHIPKSIAELSLLSMFVFNYWLLIQL